MAGACMVRAPVLEVPDFKGFRRDGLKAAPWFLCWGKNWPNKNRKTRRSDNQQQPARRRRSMKRCRKEVWTILDFLFLSARDGFWGICRRLLSGERGLRCFADAPARRSFGWPRNSQNSLGLRGGCLSECTWSSWKGRCLETCRTLGEAREDSCFQGLGVFVEGLVSHVYSCNSAWVHLIHLDAKKHSAMPAIPEWLELQLPNRRCPLYLTHWKSKAANSFHSPSTKTTPENQHVP